MTTRLMKNAQAAAEDQHYRWLSKLDKSERDLDRWLTKLIRAANEVHRLRAQIKRLRKGQTQPAKKTKANSPLTGAGADWDDEIGF